MSTKKTSPAKQDAKAASEKSIVSKLLPHAAAVLIFVIITFLFFSPMISGDKVIQQSDILQGKGANHEIVEYRNAHNQQDPLWTNSMFGGMPAFQITVNYFNNLTHYVDTILSLGFPHPSQLLFIALLGFYLLLISLGISPWLSIAGAIGFGLASYNLQLLAAGHNSKLGAMGYMPMVLAGVLMIFHQRRYILGSGIAALAIALEVRSNHLQITYYLFLMLVVLGVVEFITALKKKDLKHFFVSSGLLLICAMFGVLANIALLWSTADYAAETIRGKSELTSNTQSTGGLDEDYAFRWSYGKMETFNLLIPNFMGGSSTGELSETSNTAEFLKKQGVGSSDLQSFIKQIPLYYGDQPFTSGPLYMGAIICFLFVLGMLLVKENIKWWLFGASVLAIMLAWGHNFYWFSHLFFQYVPVYNKFRTVTMILVVVQVAFPLLAIITLSKIAMGEFDAKEVTRKLYIALGICGGLCLIFATVGPAFIDFKSAGDVQYKQILYRISQGNQQFVDGMYSALINDRPGVMRADAWRSLLFILLSAGLIYLFVRKTINLTILSIGTLAIVFIDMYTVATRYMTGDEFVDKGRYDAYFSPTAADQQILQDKSLNYRVFKRSVSNNNDPFNDSRTSYYHKSVGGYHAAKLRRYQELIENQISRGNMGVFNMMNTRYFIVSDEKQQNDVVRPNFMAMGNAWYPDNVVMVASADEEMNHIGNMYEVKMLDGSEFTVNGKKVTSAIIGNHDAVKIDTVAFDVSATDMALGATDTMGIAQQLNKDASVEKYISTMAQGAKEKFFTLRYFYTFDPKKDAIIDKRFDEYMKGYTAQPDSTRTIKLLTYAPNNLEYESKSAKEGLVVFSEIYYSKGWNAYVDGKEAPHIRANYVLRAMRIPAGNHKIEFKFEPQSYYTGEKISLASSAIILLFFAGSIYLAVRGNTKKEKKA